MPTLAPGSGSTKTAYLWAYARDDRPFGGSGPPMVVYRFEDSRAGECVARHLKGLPRDPASRRLCRLQQTGPLRSWQ
nr:IS66 family transposase [Sinorhizobium meliloti]